MEPPEEGRPYLTATATLRTSCSASSVLRVWSSSSWVLRYSAMDGKWSRPLQALVPHLNLGRVYLELVGTANLTWRTVSLEREREGEKEHVRE